MLRHLTVLLLASSPALGQVDSRSEALLTLDGYFPFDPPASEQAWTARRARVRRQVLVAAGLWPEIVRSDPDPVIHGAIERAGYTVEKIFFESLPGFHVTGNLYRPTGGRGPFPGVLSPHGHWADGRFSRISDADASAQIERGEERHLTNARFHLQARCAQLARMGCVVLHYDMIGYADSRQVEHWSGFGDVEAELWALSPFGLQTRNSIHALDVLLSLDDVDPERIAVTGASGGGTQTFVLGAVDDRPDVFFPAVMASTAMQGGCVCENASHLRVGTGNIELAAMAAPRPLGLTGANDWTREILTRGLPELRSLYTRLGAPDGVAAWCHPEFPHNYNAVSRGHMFSWLDQHLGLGCSQPIEEAPLVPIDPARLSVYDDEHPRPEGGIESVRAALMQIARRERLGLARDLGADPVEGWADYRRVVGGALEVLLHADRSLEAHGSYADGRWRIAGPHAAVDVHLTGEDTPLRLLCAGPPEPGLAEALRDEPGFAVVHPFAGTLRTDHRNGYVLYTWGYNPTHLAHRVHDLRVALAKMSGETPPALVGQGDEALAALLAAALDPGALSRLAVDFTRSLAVDDHGHRDFLPGAERWGGLAGYAALIAPTPLLLLGVEAVPPVVRSAYRAAGAVDAVRAAPRATPDELARWLLGDGR